MCCIVCSCSTAITFANACYICVMLRSCRPSMMDSIEERYEQFRTNAQQFPLVQFGLSCFSWDSDARRFDVETFQFPVFPRFAKIETSELPDRRFLVQPRCLQYIRDHGFDLNSWIDDGVSYLSHADQKQFCGLLASSAQPEVLRKFDPAVPANITADTREFLEDMTKKIKKRFAAHKFSARKHGGRRDTRGGRRRGGGNSNRSSRKDSHDDDDVCDGEDDEGGDGAGAGDMEPEERGEIDYGDDSAANGKPGMVATPASSAAELRAARRFLDAGLEHDLKGKLRCDWPSAVFLSEPLAPFRRHVLVQHLEKSFPNVAVFDCKGDNSGEDVQQNPWKRRVRLVATNSTKEKRCLLDAYEQISQQEVCAQWDVL